MNNGMLFRSSASHMQHRCNTVPIDATFDPSCELHSTKTKLSAPVIRAFSRSNGWQWVNMSYRRACEYDATCCDKLSSEPDNHRLARMRLSPI